MRPLAVVLLAVVPACKAQQQESPPRLATTDGANAPGPAPAASSTHDAPPPVAVGCSPWWSVGPGVTVRRCAEHGGIAVLLAGWHITLPSTQAWAEALQREALGARGFALTFAVQGPVRVDDRAKELPVDELLTALGAELAREPDATVLLVAHSSGAHVAARLLRRAFVSPGTAGAALRGRVVYVALDGDRGIPSDPERTLSRETVAPLRRALFVAVEDRARGLRGFSFAAAQEAHAAFPSRSDLLRFDAGPSGCVTNTCAHLALVCMRPHGGGNDSYARCPPGALNTWWIERAARWWGRGPGDGGA